MCNEAMGDWSKLRMIGFHWIVRRTRRGIA